jgi:hypothetical protein
MAGKFGKVGTKIPLGQSITPPPPRGGGGTNQKKGWG